MENQATESTKSILFLVATPIGNLQDVTYRAIDTLKRVDVIACEDTRRTVQLLNHFGISKPLIRYDEHVHLRAVGEILSLLRNEKSLALVSDAGTPAISDPGTRLVQAVTKAGFKVVPIPGPSSLTAALSASGFEVATFSFLGFLPRRTSRAKRVLHEAFGLGRTVVIFESPFRVLDTLQLISEHSPTMPVVVARELTKVHEEFLRGNVAGVLEKLKQRQVKGEIVIVAGPENEPPSALN